MLDDDAIRVLVTRLARPDGAGGGVIERAAILAEGPDAALIFAWITEHDGLPEDLAPASGGGGGLHGAREQKRDARTSRAPLRYVLPPGSLS